MQSENFYLMWKAGNSLRTTMIQSPHKPVNEMPRQQIQNTDRSLEKSVQRKTGLSPDETFRKRARRKKLLYSCVVAVVLTIGVGMIVAAGVLLGWPKASADEQSKQAMNVSLRVTSHTYTSKMADPASEEFQQFQEQFCAQVQRVLNDSSEIRDSSDCTVVALRPGSVVVEFTVVIAFATNDQSPLVVKDILVRTEGDLGKEWRFDITSVYVTFIIASQDLPATEPVTESVRPRSTSDTAVLPTSKTKTTALLRTTLTGGATSSTTVRAVTRSTLTAKTSEILTTKAKTTTTSIKESDLTSTASASTNIALMTTTAASNRTYTTADTAAATFGPTITTPKSRRPGSTLAATSETTVITTTTSEVMTSAPTSAKTTAASTHTTIASSATVAERCQRDPTSKFAHPSQCQLYYNCANTATPDMYSLFETHMEECTYPQLFSDVTLRCESYDNVTCGHRTEPMDQCEYLTHQCVRSHCIPCSVSYPSCRGLADGKNVYHGKEWSPFFAECQDQRLTGTGECPYNDTLGKPQRFSPDLMRCASMYEIPEEHGGSFFNCTGRADGLHRDDVSYKPNLYFRCENGQLTEVDACPSGVNFDSDSSQCVLSVAERCRRDPTSKFAHPRQSQLYYNCANTATPDFYSYFETHMEECPYPQLFNNVTLRCESYDNVTCDQRTEPLDQCEYLTHQCVRSHCIPCSVSYPSCRGLADGKNVYPWREWSYHFVECQDQRLVGFGECPYNDTLGVPQRFSPDLMRCASMYEIPEEHGGSFFNCTGRADGLHADYVTSRPNLYFRCENGQLSEVDLCPSGADFDSDSSQCISDPYVCSPDNDPQYIPLNYTHPRHCDQYQWCVHGVGLLRTCPNGTVFSEINPPCNFPSSSTYCNKLDA